MIAASGWPSTLIEDIKNLASQGYGWEDILVKLNLPRTSRDVVRWAVLGRGK